MLLVMVLVPASILLALSLKIKTDSYTIEVTEWERAARNTKPIQQARFMKFAAAQGAALACKIQYSDSVYYRKSGNTQDSLEVQQIGDTLVFTASTSHPSNENNDGIFVDVYMPFSGLLMLESATATIDSIPADANLEVVMNDHSKLTIGERRLPLKFSSLWVKSSNSETLVAEQTQIADFRLTLNDSSRIELGLNLQIGKMSGTVSSGSFVSGAAKWLYALTPQP